MKVAARTDIGCRRQNNEDSYAYDVDLCIFAVSDGMGGSAGGEIASALTVEQLIRSFRSLRSTQAMDEGYLAESLHRAVASANDAVYSRARSEPALSGMGATLVTLAFQEGSAVIANVGDSRAYLLRNGTVTQITHDHSLVAEQVRAGILTAEQAAVSPLQSTITRAIGIEPEVQVDLFAAQLEMGDRILLTTDGLFRYLSDEEISQLAGGAMEPREVCDALIELTRARGAADNVTCLLFIWAN